MMELAAWFLGSKVGRYIILGVVSAAIIGVFILRIYNAGKNAEQARQLEQQLKALRTRVQVDNEVSNLSRDDRRKRLQRWVRPETNEL